MGNFAFPRHRPWLPMPGLVWFSIRYTAPTAPCRLQLLRCCLVPVPWVGQQVEIGDAVWWFRIPKETTNYRLDGAKTYIKSCLNNGITYQPRTGEFTGFLNHQQYGRCFCFFVFFSPERCFFGELPWLETRCSMKWFVEFSTPKNWGCFRSWLSGKKKGPRRRCHATNEFPGLYYFQGW